MISRSPRSLLATVVLCLLATVAACDRQRPSGSGPEAPRTTASPSRPPSPDAAILELEPPAADFQRGMNLEPIGAFGGAVRLDRLPASLDALVELGVDHVAVIPSFFQRRLGDTDFVWRDGRAGVDADTRAAIRLARERGLEVLLKPHLWLESRDPDSDTWRGDILPDEDAWPRWRRSYRGAVLEYARMAAAEDVAAVSIGSELSALAVTRPEFWRRLAADVREIFPGRITYAANWDREVEEIQWWDAVDSIGVDAFWPLAVSADEEIDLPLCTERLGAVRERLAELSRQRGRPVLIAEIGYRSAAGAAWRPWEWHEDAEQSPDPELQTTLYRCIARVFSPAAGGGDPGGDAWLTGLYFWIWPADPSRGGPGDADFTPRGKPAESVLRAWFNRRSPAPPGR